MCHNESDKHKVFGIQVIAIALLVAEHIAQAQFVGNLLRQAQGTALLAQTSTREANVRAFNDVFLLNGILALLLLSWSLFHVLRIAIQAKANPPAPAGPSTGAAAPI